MWTNNEWREHDATPQSLEPEPKGEGTACLVALEYADHRLARPRTLQQVGNEVESLVEKPGLAGHKSVVMMSPASRAT